MARKPRFGIVLELDGEGRVVRSLQDPVGLRFNSVSEVEEENGILYFASPVKKSVGVARLEWFPDDTNGTAILNHPLVIEFLNDVENNLLTMTDQRIKEVMMGLIREILKAKQRLTTFNSLIVQRQTTVDRLRTLLQGDCQQTTIHRCDPATARHGAFCLLCLHPGPVRLSLDNLGPQGSPRGSISMPGSARTPVQHGTPAGRTPALKPSPSQASK
ncbi:hypothetical protein ACOMHN_012799 [Nucella lapillus]